MDSTFERWKEGRPCQKSLPSVNEPYQQNELADWLTDHPDSVLFGLKYLAEVVAPQQVDPLLANDTWLDLLSNLCGWYGLWDISWSATSKRQLLAASYTIIWPNYGTAKTLSFVLGALKVLHVIQEGESFVIGRNAVGDPLGAVAWNYDIILPSAYFNSPQFNLAKRINQLFGPIWTVNRILFDDTYFTTTQLLEVASDTALALDENIALEL